MEDDNDLLLTIELWVEIGGAAPYPRTCLAVVLAQVVAVVPVDTGTRSGVDGTNASQDLENAAKGISTDNSFILNDKVLKIEKEVCRCNGCNVV